MVFQTAKAVLGLTSYIGTSFLRVYIILLQKKGDYIEALLSLLMYIIYLYTYTNIVLGACKIVLQIFLMLVNYIYGL